VSVDEFWKRVPAAALGNAGPEALSDLVPYWFEGSYEADVKDGSLVGVEDTGPLLAALFRHGVTDEESAEAVALFAGLPPDWDHDWMVGTIAPDAVQRIARFLTGAPLAEWAAQARPALAAEAASLGYRRDFDDEWAALVLSDAREVAALFQAAATEGQPVINKISA
jgi:hypothetical protein